MLSGVVGRGKLMRSARQWWWCAVLAVLLFDVSSARAATFDLFGTGIDGQSLSSLSKSEADATLSVRAENILLTTSPHVASAAVLVGNANGAGLGVNGDKIGTQTQTGGDNS